MKSTTNARNNIILIKQYCTDKCIQVYYILPRCPRIDVGVSVVTNGHCQPLPERLWTIKPFVKTGPTNAIQPYCKYHNTIANKTIGVKKQYCTVILSKIIFTLFKTNPFLAVHTTTGATYTNHHRISKE